MSDIKIKKMDECRWIIEPFGGMKVPGILYTSERMIKEDGKR